MTRQEGHRPPGWWPQSLGWRGG